MASGIVPRRCYAEEQSDDFRPKGVNLMKRIIPVLLLAFVVAACQEDAPTVPTVGDPQFAKPDCEVDPDHPSCKDGGGGGGGGDQDYTATILQTFATSSGSDVSDVRGDGTVLVAGSSKENLGKYYAAATWTVTEDNAVDGPNPLPMPSELVDAFGIHVQAHGWETNDAGTIVVGYAAGIAQTGNEVLPVRWVAGEPDVLERPEGYPKAYATGVNDEGTVVGQGYGDADQPRVTTLWDANGTLTVLPSPFGDDRAKGINNDGHVVGASWDPEEGQSHAILWPFGGGWCDLDQGGSSYAYQITDEDSDGTVLVAGDSESPYRATIWKVHVADCDVVQFWTVGGPWSAARDVRRVDGDWEAVGTIGDAPMVWRWDGAETTETRVQREGSATSINSDGRIGGMARVKRSDQAMLWTPKSNQ
jgi:probable HAF family extracellular repeat protein